MATHNQVRVLGYLLNTPTIVNEGVTGAEKILFKMRTVRREVDGYHGQKFEDVIIFYDGTDFMERMKKLVQFDLIDIKGVFNVLTVNKSSRCPFCGETNVKFRGSTTFIYPISFIKLNNVRDSYEYDSEIPEIILTKHYMEVSNQALIIGTVVSDPEMIGTEKQPCCRYRLGVDRKYYIKTQSDLTADYPWVYTYGQQAGWDYAHLLKGSVILVDGFIHNREIQADTVCESCGQAYQYPDVATQFVPYSLEYLSGYMTDEDIALQAEMEKRQAIHQAAAAAQ